MTAARVKRKYVRRPKTDVLGIILADRQPDVEQPPPPPLEDVTECKATREEMTKAAVEGAKKCPSCGSVLKVRFKPIDLHDVPYMPQTQHLWTYRG